MSSAGSWVICGCTPRISSCLHVLFVAYTAADARSPAGKDGRALQSLISGADASGACTQAPLGVTLHVTLMAAAADVLARCDRTAIGVCCHVSLGTLQKALSSFPAKTSYCQLCNLQTHLTHGTGRHACWSSMCCRRHLMVTATTFLQRMLPSIFGQCPNLRLAGNPVMRPRSPCLSHLPPLCSPPLPSLSAPAPPRCLQTISRCRMAPAVTSITYCGNTCAAHGQGVCATQAFRLLPTGS